MALNFNTFPQDDEAVHFTAHNQLTPPWETPSAPAPVVVAGPPAEPEKKEEEAPKKKRGRKPKEIEVKLPAKAEGGSAEQAQTTVVWPVLAKKTQADSHIPRAEPGVEHALGVGKVWNLCGAAYRVIGSNDGLVVFEKIS